MNARIGARISLLMLAGAIILSPAFGQRNRGGGSQPTGPRLDFSGRVTMEDGAVPTGKITIESVCFGVVYQEGYADKGGKFRFTMANSGASRESAGPTTTISGAPVMPDCIIRAALPGYKSDIVSLAPRNQLNSRAEAENPDLGTLVLHKASGAEAASVTATSLKAPKDAKKAFEKGIDAAKGKKWEEAAKNYQKAVDLYPDYAESWYRLGEAQANLKQLDAARKSYEASVKADANYLLPYLQLANFEAQAQNWKGVADITDRVIKFAPGIPRVYLMNSISHLTLKDVEVAETSAREGLKADVRHEAPRLHQILGTILANKGEFAAAAAQFEQYLQYSQFASDAATVRKQLEELKARAAAPKQ